MQKKVIALAVTAAFSAPVYAETATSFYGIVDATVANVSGAGQKSDLVALSGGLSGSRLGFKATEDLDNGMKAIAVLEYGLDTMTDQRSTTTPTVTTTVTPSAGTATATSTSTGVTATSLFARQAMAALDTGMGTIAGGYLQTAMYDFNAKYDPTFGSQISPIQSVAKGGGFLQDAANRASRAVAYISPDFNGAKVAVNYATGLANGNNLGKASNATTGLKTTAYLLSANYAQDSLSVGAVYGSLKSDNAGSTAQTELALGISYDLGVAKVLGTYANSKITDTNNMYSLSVVAPVSEAGTVAATYAANKMKTANSNGSGFMLGYLHNLSKTTTAYAAYESVSNGSAVRTYSVANNGLSAATLDVGGSSSLIAVGLRKKF